jgi:hypothetical protein
MFDWSGVCLNVIRPSSDLGYTSFMITCHGGWSFLGDGLILKFGRKKEVIQNKWLLDFDRIVHNS